MSIAEKNRIFLEKLRSLPDRKKKIVLWTIVAILAITMGFFWVRGAMNSISKIAESTKSISLPDISMPDLPSMPSLDILQTSPTKILPEQNLGGQATPSNK